MRVCMFDKKLGWGWYKEKKRKIVTCNYIRLCKFDQNGRPFGQFVLSRLHARYFGAKLLKCTHLWQIHGLYTPINLVTHKILRWLEFHSPSKYMLMLSTLGNLLVLVNYCKVLQKSGSQALKLTGCRRFMDSNIGICAGMCKGFEPPTPWVRKQRHIIF